MADAVKKSIPDQLYDLIKNTEMANKLVLSNGSASGAGGPKLVCVDQAPVKCDNGSTETVLRIACHGVSETGLLAAHEQDRVYPANFGGNFGLCSASYKPCLPQFATRWMLPDEYTLIDKRMDLVKAQIDAAKELVNKMQDLVGKMQGNALIADKKDFFAFSDDKDSLGKLSKEINKIKKMDMDSTESASIALAQISKKLQTAETVMNSSKGLAAAAMKDGSSSESGLFDKFGAFGQSKPAPKGNNALLGPRFNQTGTMSEMQNVSDQIKSLKAQMDNLKKNWIDLETLGPCEPNSQLTTDSILPCLAHGGMIRFIESGQLRSLMTEDQYYQFIHMVGLYYNPQMTKALPAWINVGGRTIQAHQFNSKFFVANEEDLKYILRFLGVDVNPNSSQYQMLKYSSLYNIIAATGGSFQISYQGPYSDPIFKIIKGTNQPSIDFIIEQLKKMAKEEANELYKNISDAYENLDNNFNLTGSFSSGKRVIYDNHINLKIVAELSANVTAFKGNNKTALKIALTETADKLSTSFSAVVDTDQFKTFFDNKSVAAQKTFEINKTSVALKTTFEEDLIKFKITITHPHPVEPIKMSFAIEIEYNPKIKFPDDFNNFKDYFNWDLVAVGAEVIAFTVALKKVVEILSILLKYIAAFAI